MYDVISASLVRCIIGLVVVSVTFNHKHLSSIPLSELANIEIIFSQKLLNMFYLTVMNCVQSCKVKETT